MSDRIETFAVGASPRVIAATRSGDIIVVTGEPGTVRIGIDGGGAADYEVVQLGDVISAEPRRKSRFLGSSADLVITVPTDSHLELTCTSGDIKVQGAAREVRAGVASGDVQIDTVTGMCRVNSASGDIRVNFARDVEVNTASGTVRLGVIERHLRLNAASGDLFVDEIGESAICKVASSDVRINRFAGTEMRLKTMSGDLHLGIPPRRTVELEFSSLSGTLRNKLPKGDGSPSERNLSISVSAVSGDVTLTRA
jgi:DUF4097 and DUF4098 domain-containing protein YvlB